MLPSDRGREGFRLPSLRTVRAVFPHTALQSWLSSSGVSRFLIGCVQGEQPLLSEEGVWPSLMIGMAFPEAGASGLLSQERSQASSNEPVQLDEQAWSGVLEVSEPAPDRWIEVIYDTAQAVAPASA